MKRLAMLAVALAAAPAFAEGEAAPKEAPPAAAAPRPFHLPAPRQLTLPSGLKVTLVEYGVTPKALATLVVRTGNLDESESETWLTDLIAQLLPEGTTTRSAERIAQEAAGMGGSVDVTSQSDNFSIGGEVLSESAPDFVRLIADVLRNPTFEEKAVERRRGDLLRDLSVRRSQPRTQALQKLRAALFPNHALGRSLPSDELLGGYTAEKVRAFHAGHFGAARTHLYVVGKFDAAAVERAATEALGDWKRGDEAALAPATPSASRQVVTGDRPGAVQSTIAVAMPVPGPTDPDWVGLNVMNALLGGSFGSRITSNIRERKGYTYSPSGSIAAAGSNAYWLEVADVTSKDTGASLTEIFAEIDRLSKEAPPEPELLGIKRFLAGVFVIRNSSRGGIAQQLSFVDLHGLPADYLETYVSKVHGTTPEDVRRLAADFIKPGKATISVVGDLKSVQEQLNSFGTAP